jgi:iron complex outermembrane receptor protein
LSKCHSCTQSKGKVLKNYGVSQKTCHAQNRKSFGEKGYTLMQRFIIFVWAIIAGVQFTFAQAQADSIARNYHLQPVSITAYKMKWIPQADIQKFDIKENSALQTNGIATLLNDYANVNLRSYGYPGLMNVSMRGAGSNHTALLWNGFNLQDPMNGGVNMLLFPLFFVDEVQIQKGGGSALFGSGAMGGVISLENNLKFSQDMQAGVFASAGSFDNYSGGVSFRQSGAKAVFLIKAFSKYGKNDFPFINTEQFGRPEVRQENAAMAQWGLLQENAFLIKKRQRLQTHIWYQKTDHELPPNMAQMSSSKKQLDESLRGSADWSYNLSNIRFDLRSGLFFNKLHYTDPETNTDALHQSLQSISEGEMSWALFDQRDLLNAGLNYTYERSMSDQYADDVSRNRMALFASYKLALDVFTLILNGREEYVDDKFTPFTGAANLGVASGNFHIYGRFSTNYRIPTFNDLYWYDGMAKGNPDLKDESSWNTELAATYGFTKSEKQSFEWSSTAFYGRFTNLIQWVPRQGIWTPVNQKEVLSRGLENRISYKLKISEKLSIGSRISYSWIRSTLEKKAENEPDDVLHKQLILTPEHQGNVQLKIIYGVWSFEYIQSIVGKQYITADHSDAMDAYTLGNVVFGYSGKSKRFPLSIYLRWNNIWKTVYQTMPGYAMPLANYELSTHLLINQKAKK